ncbi:MAG TPA: hypothetical protein VGR16_09535, partial [Thermomicrobiales bacterium]|nr:hypothetical protein [Thermomicrobiales bacterium]
MTSLTSSIMARHSFPTSFAEWHRAISREQRLPLIAIAGTRGKSTVIRLLDHIFRTAGIRTATWTDEGVEIDGRAEPGELAPWQHALTRLNQGTIDVAIQELDWPMVQAVGLPSGVYPIVAVTNICANSDACLAHDDAKWALDAYPAVLRALMDGGRLVVNAEDYSVANHAKVTASTAAMVGQRPDTPLLKRHLEHGGSGAWTDGESLFIGTRSRRERLVHIADLSFALEGAATFEIQNALIAATVARACGMPASIIGGALAALAGTEELVLGSFNILRIGETLAVIERPLPSWFLRPVLRALSLQRRGRLLAMLGGTSAIPDDDLVEFGRLIGRASDALILNARAWSPEQAALIKRGVVQNELPPVLVHVPGEEQAISRTIRM